MEHLSKLLTHAARAVMLELEIPPMRQEQAYLQKSVKDLKTDLDWCRLEAKNLEAPGFFLRIFGMAEKKQEKAQAETREAAAAYESAKRELDTLMLQLEKDQAELDSLQGAREAYDRERQAFLRIATDEELRQLQELETDAFRPAAILTVKLLRKALQNAHPSMVRDVKTTRYDGAGGNRKLEFLHLADDYAKKLQEFRVYFPDGSIPQGLSLTQPSAYVNSATMDYKQLDLLNTAIDQARRVQERLTHL